MAYERFPIETDPDSLTDMAFDYLQSVVTGWTPAEGNLDVWLIEANARMSAEVRDVAADVPDTIFYTYGTDLIGLPPYPATPAVTVIRFTAYDDLGHTVPAGTLVGISAVDGTSFGFTTDTDAPIPAGQTFVDVSATCIDAGVAANGIAPTATNATLIDSLEFPATVTQLTTTVGGADEESPDAYRERLSAYLRLLTPTPILPDDFAAIAKLRPDVVRAQAIDLYEPGPPVNTNAARTVSVAVVGTWPPEQDAAKRAEIQAELAAFREVNFVVHVIPPTYTTINVVYQVVMLPGGFDSALVVQACNDQLAHWLSPTGFGNPMGDDPKAWIRENTVRYYELIAQLDRVEGVDYVKTASLNGGTADVVMTGAAPLPQLGTVNGTALPPTSV